MGKGDNEDILVGTGEGLFSVLVSLPLYLQALYYNVSRCCTQWFTRRLVYLLKCSFGCVGVIIVKLRTGGRGKMVLLSLRVCDIL